MTGYLGCCSALNVQRKNSNMKTTLQKEKITMSDVYAVREDNGKRVLVELQCDGCDAVIKPNPQIASSGWVYKGQDDGPGTDKLRWDYCPDCARKYV